MGGWKKCDPSVYVVAWDDEQIVKAGYSAAQRWRRFMLRGARLMYLWSFDSTTTAIAVETWADDQLRSAGTRAFTNAAESSPFLGADGAGWCECWRIRPSVAARMLSDAPEHMPKHRSIASEHRIAA